MGNNLSSISHFKVKYPCIFCCRESCWVMYPLNQSLGILLQRMLDSKMHYKEALFRLNCVTEDRVHLCERCYFENPVETVKGTEAFRMGRDVEDGEDDI